MNAIHWERPRKSFSQTDPMWFGVALGLMGVMLGFGIGTFQHSHKPPLAAPALVAVRPIFAASSSSRIVVNPLQAPPVALTVPTVDRAKDHILGNKDAGVALIEYSDLECPSCRSLYPTLQQVMTQDGGKVMWVYRHYPLSFHKNAEKDAEATECAAELGGNDAFWKFITGIFQVPGGVSSSEQFSTLAKQAGLNGQAFTACLASGKYASSIAQMESVGLKGGVNATPTVFIVNLQKNTARRFAGSYPLATIQALIDAQTK